MFNNDLENDLIWQTIRELTFNPNISIPVLAESVSENRMGREDYDIDIKDKKSSVEYVNGYKRFQRLFQILSKESNNKKSISELITAPKIYDDILNKKRISLYNNIAEKWGWHKIANNPPSIASLIRAAEIDGGNADDKIIVKYYPYYFKGERKGMDFIEYILLLNISLITRSRTQTFFENQLKDPSDKQGIKYWIDRVILSMHSESVYMSYVDTFFSTFYYVTSKQYNEILDVWRQLIQIPEDEFYNYIQYNRLYDLIYDKNSICEMQEKLMLVIWRLINCENSHNYKSLREKRWLEKIDGATKEISEQYISLITNYIDQAILEAESILPTFFNI